MKSIEIDSSKWSYWRRKKAINKLRKLGYQPTPYHGTKGFKGKSSITAYNDGRYSGYDLVEAWAEDNDLTPTFKELMALTKEDVQ